MQKALKRFLFTGLLVLLTLFFGGRTTFAQAPQLNLTVSPVVLEYETLPGETIKDKFRLRNNSQATIPLKASLQRLVPRGEFGEGTIADIGPEDEFANWVVFEKPTFTAPPNTFVDVPFTLSIPQTAAFGYYFAFSVSQDPGSVAASESGARILGSISIPVLLQVQKEGAKAQASLLSFAPNSFVNEYLPITFTARVQNTGNIHLKPRGNIFIRGSGDKDMAILEINQELGSILPSGIRSYQTSWDDGFLVNEPVVEDNQVLRDEKGNPKTRLSIYWNKLTDFRFGRYTGHLLMVYDNGTRDVPLEAKADFWVIPYTALGIVLVVIIGGIFVFRLLLRSYVASELRKRQK